MIDRILNPTPTFYKYDRFVTGFIPGLLCPLLAFVFFYTFQMKSMTFAEYLHHMMTPSIIAKILSFGCIINLLVFFLFISRDYYNAARGVIMATIFWALPILYYKFK